MSDLISRKEAICAIEHRLAEPAYLHIGEDWYVGMNCAESELYNLPSTHLEPCEDAVSRADVIDMLEMYPFTEYGEYESARETVKRLPSVKPKRKKGKWIPRESIFGGPDEKVYTCNQCGYNIGFRAENFCPHCGSEMGGDIDGCNTE